MSCCGSGHKALPSLLMSAKCTGLLSWLNLIKISINLSGDLSLKIPCAISEWRGWHLGSQRLALQQTWHASRTPLTLLMSTRWLLRSLKHHFMLMTAWLVQTMSRLTLCFNDNCKSSSLVVHFYSGNGIQVSLLCLNSSHKSCRTPKRSTPSLILEATPRP